MFKYFLTLVTLVNVLFAQNFEGKITFEIIYPDIPEKYAELKAKLPQEMSYFTKDGSVKFDYLLEFGGIQTVYKNIDSNKLDQFIDYNDGVNKIHIHYSEKEVKEIELTREAPEITYYKDSTKLFDYYNCYKARAFYKSDSSSINLWVTDDLPNNIITEFKNLAAFPVAFESVYWGYRTIMILKEVDQTTLPEDVMIFPKGYTTYTPEEYLNNVR